MPISIHYDKEKLTWTSTFRSFLPLGIHLSMSCSWDAKRGRWRATFLFILQKEVSNIRLGGKCFIVLIQIYMKIWVKTSEITNSTHGIWWLYYHHYTEEGGSGGDTSDLYSGGVWFESQLGHCSYWGFSWFFSVPLSRWQYSTLNWAMIAFSNILSNSLYSVIKSFHATYRSFILFYWVLFSFENSVICLTLMVLISADL